MKRITGITGCLLLSLTIMSAGLSAQQRMDEMWDGGQAKSNTTSTRGQLFENGNYAMFIHWGLFSKIANKWDGKTYYGIGEWMMNDNMAGITPEQYKKVAPTFNPTDFDARKIARLAKDAGMKYIIITSKHHDGFAMYHSKCDSFNIVDATPFGRDPMKELSDACRELGLGFGFYYSHNQDWTTPGGAGGPETDSHGNKRTIHDYFHNKCLPQVEEITKNYGDIELIWFDTPGAIPQKYAEQLVDVVHRNQPNALVSGRVGYNLGDYQTLGDMEVPLENIEGMWESVDVTNDAWGYAWYDRNWKTPAEILRRLISTVARGGTYMLNIGPDGMGNVPEGAAEALRSSGRWIARNPQVIYNAGASPWKHRLAWGDAVSSGNRLYLAVYKWPTTGKLHVPGLQSRIVSAAVCDSTQRIPLEFVQSGSHTVIDVPYRKPDPMVSVIELVMDNPDIKADPVQAVDPEFGIENLSVIFARTDSCSSGKTSWMEKFGEWKHEYCVNDLNKGGRIVWTVDIVEPATFQVDINVRGNGKGVWKAETDEGQSVQNQQSASSLFARRPLGWLQFERPGRHTITLSMPEGGNPCEISSITLTPVVL